MKNKLISLLSVSLLTLSITACGSSAPAETKAPETQTVAQTEAVTEAPTEAPTEATKEGFYEDETAIVEYTRHEVKEDWEGKKALFVYFNYTNKAEDAGSAVWMTYLKGFQNGIEMDTTFSMEPSEEENNYSKEIKTGVTLECCTAFALTDDSDVTMEIGTLASSMLDTEVPEMVFTVK